MLKFRDIDPHLAGGEKDTGQKLAPAKSFCPGTTVPQNQRPPRRAHAKHFTMQRIVQWHWEGIALPEVAGDGLATHLAIEICGFSPRANETVPNMNFHVGMRQVDKTYNYQEKED